MVKKVIKTILIIIVVVALVDAVIAATARDWGNVALFLIIALLLWPREAR
jgi:hypothetical protein